MKTNKILIFLLMSGMLTSCQLINNGNLSGNNSSSNSDDTSQITQDSTTTTPNDGGNEGGNQPGGNEGGNQPGGNEGGGNEGEQDNEEDVPENPNPDPSEGLNDNHLANNPQEGTILHAWSWNLKAIKQHLPEIKAAGYSSVQTSPMQPQKDFWNGDHWKSWWKAYQPFGFEIATSNNAMGTKEDLRDLCNEADKYGIKVIVDVVANHLAGGDEESLNPKTNNYEPEIYSGNLLHKGYGYANDEDPISVVRGNIGGYPDLQTETETVQNAVKDLLHEYIDVGVDGFRFDAAKHIELPEDDEAYASNFWNVAIGEVATYASNKGLKKPFNYGEILHTVGQNRKFSHYTKRMSVTDSDASASLLSAVHLGDGSLINTKNIYKPGVPSHRAVLWGESHDTFANDDGPTKYAPQEDVNKAYAIAASRNHSSALYFIRPDDSMKFGGESSNENWKSPMISAVNNFHNDYLDCKEDMIDGLTDYYINIKTKDNKNGAVVVNLSKTSQVVINTNGLMKDGYYIDKVSNKHFQVKNGTLNGLTNETDVAVLYPSDEINPDVPEIKPNIQASIKDGSAFLASVDVTFTVNNCDSATIQVGDGPIEELSGSKTVLIGKDVKDSFVTVKITATLDGKTYTKEFKYGFFAPETGVVKVVGIDPELLKTNDFGIWIWNIENNGSTSKWIIPTINNDVLSFEHGDNTHFIIAYFDKGAEIDWSNKIKQTNDIPLDKSIYTSNDFTWQ